MARTVKTAILAALGGSGFALTVAWLAQGPALAPPAGRTPPASKAETLVVPERCQAITVPESGCETAWAARRRAFFGREDRPR